MRRSRAAAVLAAAVLAGCGGARSTDDAAEVDGTGVSRDRFEQLMRAVTANPELFNVEEDLPTGTINGDAGRNLLSALVIDAASREFLAAAGESITDADREAVLAELAGQAETVPAEVLDLVVDQRASATVIGRVASATGDAQARYESSPAEVGVLCVRHILVETEDEADAVLDELAGGADFADLASERSTEPAAAETGGAIELQPGQPCLILQQAETSLDAVFVAAATEAVPGTPTGPVQTSFGWHVILARPYEEVAATVDQAVGQLLFEEHLADVDVEVDPRYGRWDPLARSVVAL